MPHLPFTYDALDWMTALRESGPVTMVAFSYDSAARRAQLAFGPGATSSTTSYGYDGASRLTALTHDLAGTANDQSQTFGYNAASQITSRTSSNDLYASNTAYAVNRTYAVNGLNQYTAAGSATFAYDANGSLTSDGSRTFTYDAENRLVAASGGVTLAYDPLGRLWQVNGASGITRFVYDGDRLLEEYDSAGVRTRGYAWGPNPDEPLIWYQLDGTPVRRFLHADHQGSIVSAVDDVGNPVAINAYDAWGIPNAGNVGRFQYTGQAWLAELGMYYYKARIYSPTLNRFMQTDPVGYADQINLYEYVGDDPLNHADPSGECQNRDNAGECVVTNRAGTAGEAAASHLQTQVRTVDHAIRGLDPKQRIRADVGNGHFREMTGRQVQQAWARTDWIVDDNGGHNFANGNGAQMDNGVYTGRPSYLEGFRSSAHDWYRDENEATRSLVLHDFSHSTPLGRQISSLFPGRTGQYNETGERATSRVAREIGNATGVTFECRTFITGC